VRTRAGTCTVAKARGGRDSEEGEDGAVRQLDIQDAWGRIRAGWTESGNLIEF
jgi:hypothetical protein